MAEVGTSVPKELLWEIVQFLRLPECSRLTETSSVLTYFIIPHGTRLRDAATERTSVVYVKTPAGREQEQETITQQLIDAFKDARFEIVDKEGRGMQYVVFKKSACVRYLLAYTKNGALFDLVTSGYVCAIPITGLQLFTRVAPVIDNVLAQYPSVRRLDFAEDSCWISRDYTAGRGVVLAIEDAGHAMAAGNLVAENGGFKII